MDINGFMDTSGLKYFALKNLVIMCASLKLFLWDIFKKKLLTVPGDCFFKRNKRKFNELFQRNSKQHLQI